MDNLAPVLSASHCVFQKKGHSVHGALSVLTSWKKEEQWPCHALYPTLYHYEESFWNVCFSGKIHCAIVLMTIHWHAVLRQSLMRKAIRWRQAVWRYLSFHNKISFMQFYSSYLPLHDSLHNLIHVSLHGTTDLCSTVDLCLSKKASFLLL